MHHRDRQTPTPRQHGTKPRLPAIHLPYFRVKQRHLEEYLVQVYRMDGFDFTIASALPPECVPNIW